MAASNRTTGRTGRSVRRPRGVAKRGASILLETAGAAKPVAIALRPRTFKTLAGQPSLMAALIETYGAALEKSRLIGQPVEFTVNVEPRGAPRITPIDRASPAYEATGSGRNDLDGALAAARQRGRHRVAEILSGPDMLSAAEFAGLIGTSRVTVNARRQSRQVLGLKGTKRGYRFPGWQVDDDGKPFAALPALFERLGESPWAVYRFLVQHHPELDGETGRDALRRGREAEVMEAAESVARDFA